MYCIAYRLPVGTDSIKNLSLFISSGDYLNYEYLNTLNLAGSSSETTLSFANDSMYFIARTETINTQRAFEKKDEFIKMIDEDNLLVRTQDLPARFHDAWQFYWLTSQSLLSDKKIDH